MDYSSLQTIADSQNWLSILPEILLAVSGLALLLMDVLIPRKANSFLPYVALLLNAAVLGFVLLGGSLTSSADSHASSFAGMIRVNELSHWFRVFFLVSNLGISWIALNYFKKQKLVRTEFFAVTMVVSAALMLLALSQHFLMVFVSLETVAIGLYVLVAYDRNSFASLESGIKYLVMGGTNTAILLLGIVLVYGVAGNPELAANSTNPLLFSNLSEFAAQNTDSILLKFGVLAILASIAFKIGLVPFQIWIPDVYQGAPTPTTAFLSVSSKAGGFVLLFLMFGKDGVFSALNGFVYPILLWATIISLLYGNLTALGYTNIKRLLGMSGVSHAGFLMIGFLVLMQSGGVAWINGAILFYLAVYLLASLAVFAVMSIVAPEQDHTQDVYDYTDLAKSYPFLAAVLTLGIGSMAGIPPLVGFVAKFSLFVAAFKSGMFLLLGVAVVSVVISIFYYFKWIRELYFKDALEELKTEDEKQQSQVVKTDVLSKLLLGVLAAAILILGVYPMNLISSWSF